MKALGQLFVANLKELIRDRMAMFWFLAFPVLFILIFGVIFSGGGTTTYDVGYVADDSGVAGTSISMALSSVPVFNLHTGGREAEMRALEKGQRSFVVVVPEGASQRLLSGQEAEILVYYDASRKTTNQVFISVLKEIAGEIERRITGAPKLFEVKAEPVQSKDLRDIDYLLPGILAMALMQLGLFGALGLATLREKKVLKNLGATPLPRQAMVLSEAGVRLLMALVQTMTIVLIGHLAFDVTILGNWLAVFGLVLLGAASFASMGYMLVSFMKTQESAQGIIQVVQFPMMFLSGIFFPVEYMPGFLKPVVQAMPLTYLGDALRQVMVGAAPIYPLKIDVLVLAGWMVVTLAVAIRFWRWE